MGNSVRPSLYAPLNLAYIGDSIYETINRIYALEKGSRPVNKLHRECSGRAKAPFQARMMEFILPHLTEEEAEIFRRARNADVYTKAKNATMAEYHMATAFEAVIGFLFLSGEDDRMIELIKMGWEGVGQPG